MGLFGKKKVSVTVHGSTSTMTGSDGRYAKQARSIKKAGRERLELLDRYTERLLGDITGK